MDRITRNGVSLAFEDVGKGAPPLLLIHDLGSEHTSLHPQLKYFRRKYRVVAVDLPGHGGSDRLPGTHTIVAFVEILAWLCYELGVYRPVAVGRGIGGMIAVELAVRFPDLLAAVVALDTPRTSPSDFGNGGGRDVSLVAFGGTFPMPYVQTGTSGAGADGHPTLNPGMVGETVRVVRLSSGESVEQINAKIDAFLVALLA